MNNILKTTFLLSLLPILLVVMGGAVGGQGGMIIACLIASTGRPNTRTKTLP